MARTRYVYPSDMVAHLWANKAQDARGNAAAGSTSSGTRSTATAPIFPLHGTWKTSAAARCCSPPAITAQPRRGTSGLYLALVNT